MKLSGLGLLAALFFTIVSYSQDYKGWHLKDAETDTLHGISVNKAYDFLKGKKVKPIVVAVLDSGIDTLHEDLKPVLWHNPKEIPGNGKDDDGNGYVDDVYGWNFLGNKNGEMVVKASSEAARIYHKYKDKFAGKTIDVSQLSAEEKAQYELWKQADKKLTPKPDEQLNAAFIEIALSSVKKFDKAIREDWKKEEYTIDELSSNYEPSTPAGRQAKNGYLGYMRLLTFEGNTTNTQIISEMNEYVESKRSFFTAKETEPEDVRKIIGDNYYDLNDKYYGNSNVMGGGPVHGTHVSGIIAAVRNNGVGIDGVADNVKIMMVRTVPNGDEYDKDVALAIRYAVDNGAKIINMSFGKDFSPEKKWVDDAIKYAEAHDVLLVHAAGNDAENMERDTSYPSPYFNGATKKASNVITVGASTDPRFKGQWLADFSNYGNITVDVFAPGEKIYSTLPGGNKYGNEQGTSMAAPVVSGIAALIWSHYPNLTAQQVKEAIEKTVWKTNSTLVNKPGTKDTTTLSELSVTGGIVNAFEAVKYAEELSKRAVRNNRSLFLLIKPGLMPRPQSTDHAAYYSTYIDKVKGENVKDIINTYSEPLLQFYTSLPEGKADYRYSEDKWTVKELLLHMIDAERVFSYRAMRIARKDKTPLPGFDENAYTPASKASGRSLQSLKDEFVAVRKATDIMLSTFDEEQLSQKGTASEQPVTANAIAFIIYGHMIHHKQVLEERYLK